MIGCIRETGLVAPLAGSALMATVLVGISACAGLPFSLHEETTAKPVEVDAAPAAVAQRGPAPEERMPPPFIAAQPQTPPPLPRDKPALVLTVESGDSVGGIAQRYGVTAIAIIVFNELSHPYWLHIGQQLAVPRAGYVVALRDEPAVEEYRQANGEAVMTVAAIEEGPAAPVSVEPEQPTRKEAVGPAPRTRAVLARRTDVEPQESIPLIQATPEESAPVIQAEPAAAEPPRSRATRLARAEPEATPPRPTLYALALQPVADDVPLPPSRNTFLWPIEGSVISGFGAKPGGKHNDGINIAAPVGSEVRAAKSGVVAYAGNELRGYGNLVLIRHDGGWMTAYAHNDALLVGKGDVVRRGQVISHSGRSGGVSRPQTHFEIRHDGEPQDPLRLLTRK